RELAKIPATSQYRKAAAEAVDGARKRELQLDVDRLRAAAAHTDGCASYARLLREITAHEPPALAREVSRAVSCATKAAVKPPEPPKIGGSGSNAGSGSGFGGRM